jgi:hypothetical protein
MTIKKFQMRHFTAVLIFGFASHCFAGGQQAQDQKSYIPESYVALLHSDIQSQKTAVIGQNLSLTEDEAQKFWPLQRSYESDLSKLDDERLNIIREYSKNWDDLSDEAAKGLGKRLLEYHKKRVELAQKYFDRISKELSPTVAAKFFQIEIQLEDLIDVAIGSSIPLIKQGGTDQKIQSPQPSERTSS